METGEKNMLKYEGRGNEEKSILSKRYKISYMDSGKDALVPKPRMGRARHNNCQPLEREGINSTSSSSFKRLLTFKNFESTKRETQIFFRGFDELSEGHQRLWRVIDTGTRRWLCCCVMRERLDATADSYSNSKDKSELKKIKIELETKLARAKIDAAKDAKQLEALKVSHAITIGQLQVEAGAKPEEMAEECDRLRCHLMSKGYPDEETVIGNKGDDTEHLEGETEQARREINLSIKVLETELAKEKKMSTSLLSSQEELQFWVLDSLIVVLVVSAGGGRIMTLGTPRRVGYDVVIECVWFGVIPEARWVRRQVLEFLGFIGFVIIELQLGFWVLLGRLGNRCRSLRTPLAVSRFLGLGTPFLASSGIEHYNSIIDLVGDRVE
ncbi:hypothetical protein GIB67_014240 [Kingdonia uniflora]|uniref:Uncharacterized protein n=1 Tax=Kingdonia uniflora TaxID=39325 RepID=A0A7J7M1W6_9MAGN|nr:hypothetical protein GIB67_014240 [Kingdonia uniflora]